LITDLKIHNQQCTSVYSTAAFAAGHSKYTVKPTAFQRCPAIFLFPRQEFKCAQQDLTALSQRGFVLTGGASLVYRAASLGLRLSHSQDINAAGSHKLPCQMPQLQTSSPVPCPSKTPACHLLH